MDAEKLRCLMVEDDPDDFFLIRQMLSRCMKDAEVRHAPSFHAALELAGQGRFDVCLLDYRLGERNGLELLAELKRHGEAAPVIFLTGQGDEEIAVAAMKAGAADYLSKAKLNEPALCKSVRYAVALRRKEEALRQSEREYRMLFESANDAIIIFDPTDERILEANPRACSMYEYRHDELIGRSLRELHADGPGFQEAVARVRRLGLLKDYEALQYRRDRSALYVLANASIIQYRGREAVLMLSRDISERRAAEAELRTLYRAVEQAADMVIITDPSGSIEYVNPAFEKVTGFARAEVLGKNPRILGSGQQPRSVYSELWSAILAGKVYRNVLVNRKKNGKLYYAEKTITPVLDENGAIVHFISNDRDITERRELERQLLHAQKMDAVGQLAGGIAHDFNNLLLVISSYAELLASSLAQDCKALHHAQEIQKAARRAASLTRQLLAFSRKQVMSPAVLDLNSVIADFSKMLPRLIGEDIHLVINTAPDLWRVRADPMLLEQVMMNLAVNARDAMPHGGQLTFETGNVELDEDYARRHAGVKPGDHVMLAVTDTGCGIDPEILPHIFEPFFTTKERGKGTGLGLPTAYGIVKQSGGSIWVYSEVGQGTVFKVYFPRIVSAATANAALAAPHMAQRASETVLLVEDEDAVRESTSEFLTLRGYTVLQGSNGQDALRVLDTLKGKLDLLITDVVMPGMSGRELADRVLSLRPETRVLYVSGYTESMILRHGVEPVEAFLQKPFSLNALAGKVREVLNSTPQKHGSPNPAAVA